MTASAHVRVSVRIRVMVDLQLIDVMPVYFNHDRYRHPAVSDLMWQWE